MIYIAKHKVSIASTSDLKRGSGLQIYVYRSNKLASERLFLHMRRQRDLLEVDIAMTKWIESFIRGFLCREEERKAPFGVIPGLDPIDLLFRAEQLANIEFTHLNDAFQIDAERETTWTGRGHSNCPWVTMGDGSRHARRPEWLSILTTQDRKRSFDPKMLESKMGGSAS